MCRTKVVLMTAYLLSLAPAMASAQTMPDSPRQAIELAQRLSHHHVSLAEAIASAEASCGGTAIAVRLSLDHIETLPDTATLLPSGQVFAAPPMAPDKSKTLDQKAKATPPALDDPTSLYAVVTCVIDASRTRDVVIDLSDDTVVGMHHMGMMSRSRGSTMHGPMNGRSEQAMRHRATDLMNCQASNQAGEDLGSIDDLAIDPASGRVVYGVLRRGGILGMNQSSYAVSLVGSKSGEKDDLVIAASESDFKGREGFDTDHWPLGADEAIGSKQKTATTNVVKPKSISKASKIIGSQVMTRDGKKAGTISDLVIDAKSSQIAFVIISTDRGQVQCTIKEIEMTAEKFKSTLTTKELQARPILNARVEPDWNDTEPDTKPTR